MSNIRIYTKPDNLGELIRIRGKDTVHKIKDVLRLKTRDNLYVFDGKGREYLCEIRAIEKKEIILNIKEQVRYEPICSSKVVLGFPLLREDKLDFIIQKSTELGAKAFIPFISSRSLQAVPSTHKIERWQKIVIEASRQSGRLWIPEIYRVRPLAEISREDYPVKLAASIDGDAPQKILSGETEEVLTIVGPEGDFSPSEYEELKSSGFKFINLSPYILRTETAAIFATGLIRV